MVALLNQDRFVPMPVEEQVAVMFAGDQGFLDDIELARVGEFVVGLPEYLKAQHGELLAAIAAEGALSDEIQDRLRDAVAEYHRGFAPEDASPVAAAASTEAAD